MWLYRRMLRISWTEKRTNDSILEALKVPRKMLKLINRRKLKYIGHASRNQSTNLMTIAYQGKLEGRNCKGRPAVSVIENVKKASGLKLQEVSWKSENRVLEKICYGYYYVQLEKRRRQPVTGEVIMIITLYPPP